MASVFMPLRFKAFFFNNLGGILKVIVFSYICFYFLQINVWKPSSTKVIYCGGKLRNI